MLCALGTFTVNGSIIEVGIMFACGVLGLCLRIYGFSPAALVIALVLGPLAEETLRQTMIISGGSFDIFVQRGASQALIAVIAVLVVLPLLISTRRRVTTRAVRRRADATDPADRDSAQL